MFIPQNHNREYEHAQSEKPVFRASLALSMLEIELYQISLPYDRGRSGYEISFRSVWSRGLESWLWRVFSVNAGIGAAEPVGMLTDYKAFS